MRKLALSLLSVAALSTSVTLTSCKKTETDNLSRIKNYPSVVLNGNEFYVINVGETFTDPGVTATLGDQSLTATVTGTVGNTKPGLYTITYGGANTEGDAVSTVRSVIVTDPLVNNLDQSGTFQRTVGTVTYAISPVKKIGTKGLYSISNFGFTNAPNNGDLAYFVQIDASHIVVPAQTITDPTNVAPTLGYTTFTAVTGTFTAGKLTKITYAVHSPTVFGSSARAATRI